MLDVKVKFHGVIRDVTKSPTAQLSLPEGSTVRDLIATLHARYGQPFAERVLDPTFGVKTWVKLFLGNTELDYRALDTQLDTGGPNVSAILFVLPATTGGCVR